jgi:hypothetical protein
MRSESDFAARTVAASNEREHPRTRLRSADVGGPGGQSVHSDSKRIVGSAGEGHLGETMLQETAANL